VKERPFKAVSDNELILFARAFLWCPVTQNKKIVYAIAGASVLAAAVFALYLVNYRGPVVPGINPNHATAEPSGSLTIVTFYQGKLAPGASYRIASATGGADGNYTVRDGETGIDGSPVDGIISLQGMADGTFSVIQVVGPAGHERDIIPKIVEVSNSSSELVTFGASQVGTVSQAQKNDSLDEIESVLYSAKFECGTIRGGEGPLRPGHYDTDIGIYNKQRFLLQFTWSLAANNKVQQNAILKTLNSQSSSSIVCDDINKLAGIGGNFTEGYVLIEVPLDPKLRGSISGGSAVLDTTAADKIDLLEVQTFYIRSWSTKSRSF
jgi:hypothetical protein